MFMAMGPYRVRRRLGSVLVDFMDFLLQFVAFTAIQCNIYVYRIWIFPVINGMS